MIYKDVSVRLNERINNKLICDAMAGSTAAVVSVLANTPVDVIKTRMQSIDAARYRSFLHCGQTILLEQGPLGFYRGCVPPFFGSVIYRSVQFAVFEAFYTKWAKDA